MNKTIRISLELILGILGCLLAVFTLLFGDNIYQQLTGRSIFQNPTISNFEIPTTQAQSATEIPLDTSVPLEYISAVDEYGVLKFGPIDGSIYNDGDSQGDYDIDGLYKNFILEVKIRNPYSTSIGRWSYGINFRNRQGDGYFNLYLGENRSWFLDHYLASSYIQSEGHTLSSLDIGDNSTNIITLLCRDDIGLFYVNGTFASQLDLSYGNNSGYISIVFPAFSDQQVPGYSLHFEDLRVWTFPE